MTKRATVVPAPPVVGKEKPSFLDSKQNQFSWRYKSDVPTVEPLLVSERFNSISRGHLEDILPELRRKEHFNLVLRSDMHCEDKDLPASGVELPPPGKWTIDPRDKKWVAYFDQAIAVSLVYTAFVTPYEIGFLIGGKPSVDPLFILGNLINMVFMIDFVLNFFLQFQRSSENGGIYEGDHKEIVKNYLRTHCIVDFASSVPWDAVEMVTGGDGRLSAMRLLRLLRLLKLLRIVRGSRLIEKYKAEFQFSFAHVTLGLYVGTIMLFAHWVACLWGYAATSREIEDTWMVAEGIEDASPFTQYTVALYFATMTITTVGYGDVTPQNRDEYILVTVVMIAGGFLWAYVIGGICSLVATMNYDKRRFQQDFDRVNSMLEDLGMPGTFCTYVRRYLFNAESMLRRNTYNDLINLLTPHQQREIAVHRSRANLVQIPYLRDCTPECVLKIYSALKQMVYAPQEMLDLPNTLYILVNNGIVVKSGNVFMLGSCLAVDFILENEALIDKSVGTALTFVQVETLHRSVLFSVLEQFPIDKAVVRRAKVRLSLMRKVVELAQIELIRRKNDKYGLKRWSVSTASKNSLSSRPVRTRRISPKEGSVMFELAPASSELSKLETQEEQEASHKMLEGMINQEEGEQSIRSSFIDTISNKGRQFVEEKESSSSQPSLSGALLYQQEFPFRPFPGDANALAADQTAQHEALHTIKTEVERVSERTCKIEKTMEDITETLTNLNRLLTHQESKS